jgi:hypothetical protein
MRYYCHFCHKSVTSEVPDDTLVRAVLICSDCIEKGKIVFPEEKQEPIVKKGDKIYWNLEAIELAKNQPQNPILLEVERIDVSIDGTKVIWMRMRSTR